MVGSHEDNVWLVHPEQGWSRDNVGSDVIPGDGVQPETGDAHEAKNMSSSPTSDNSESTATTSSRRWGENDPGLDVTGVHLKVMGGRPVWPMAIYKLMAAEDRRAFVVGLQVQADYTPMPLAPQMGGARFYDDMVCGCAVNWTGVTVEPGEADAVLAALGLLHNRVKCVIPEEYGGDYQPEVSTVGVLSGCSREC